jgi:hypothetical protein
LLALKGRQLPSLKDADKRVFEQVAATNPKVT